MPQSPEIAITAQGHQLKISNPDKLLWQEMGITKSIYLEKLVMLSPYLLPRCQNRLLTTIRYPHGVHNKFFYQKNAPEPLPSFVHTARDEDIQYVVLDQLATLLWLGNLACIEFHPSLHYAHEPLPCEWIIDLDPSISEEPRIMEAAWKVGQVLNSLGIQSIPKTSGATGVQIIVPIQYGITFDELRSLGYFIAQYTVQKYPSLFTIERLKKHRGSHIYFDYLQHYKGKTIAAAYTPRANKYACVSTPLTWEEVERSPHPSEFHLLNIEHRLQQKGDLLVSVPPQNLKPIVQQLGKMQG